METTYKAKGKEKQDQEASPKMIQSIIYNFGCTAFVSFGRKREQKRWNGDKYKETTKGNSLISIPINH